MILPLRQETFYQQLLIDEHIKQWRENFLVYDKFKTLWYQKVAR